MSELATVFFICYGAFGIIGALATFSGLRSRTYTSRKGLYMDLGLTFGWPVILVAGAGYGVYWCIVNLCKFFWFNPVKAFAELPPVTSLNDETIDDDGTALGGAVTRVTFEESDIPCLEFVAEHSDLN